MPSFHQTRALEQYHLQRSGGSRINRLPRFDTVIGISHIGIALNKMESWDWAHWQRDEWLAALLQSFHQWYESQRASPPLSWRTMPWSGSLQRLAT